MLFEFKVQCEVSRQQGKFRSREEIAEQLMDALSEANPQSIEIDESEYSVDSWDCEEAVKEKPPKRDKKGRRTVTNQQVKDFLAAHAEGLHEGAPREFCPECERSKRDVHL